MFSDYKKRFIFFGKLIEDGWQDIGSTGYLHNEHGTWARINFQTHEYCGEIIRIGREDDKPFRFCPLCYVKIGE